MKIMASFVAAAGFSLLVGAGAFAQAPADDTDQAPATTTDQTTTEPTGASSTSGGEITENYGTVVEAIEGLADAPDLATMSDVSTIDIVLLTSLQGDPNHDQADLEATVQANQDAITSLQQAVSANEALTTKLQDAGQEPASVLAIGQNADGNWRLYVDDRED